MARDSLTRDHSRPATPHLRRMRSIPSMFSTVGALSRGRAKALAALHMSTTSCPARRAWKAPISVCSGVSRCFPRGARAGTTRIPRWVRGWSPT
ncbi:MAG: hypothetical protein R3F62_01450 [Planctomycetota bacterium]